MNLREYRTVLVALGLVLMLIVTVAVISAFWPKYEERFFALGILDGNKRAEHYYPNDDSNIGINSLVQWYIYVYNHMGSAQNVSIKVKLLNSTLQGPDTSKRVHSPIPDFYNFSLALNINETQLLPFFWYISEATPSGNFTIITQLVINNETLDLNDLNLNVSAVSGFDFRMVFELWVYNEASGNFEFTWESKEESYCAWNQMWFNATLPE